MVNDIHYADGRTAYHGPESPSAVALMFSSMCSSLICYSKNDENTNYLDSLQFP